MKEREIIVSITKYGFQWGPVVVERVAHIEGRGYVVSVRSSDDYDGPEVQVIVSDKGRKMTVRALRGARVKAEAP